jgi:RNA polymerase sigma-70 factor, ECF subfamily
MPTTTMAHEILALPGATPGTPPEVFWELLERYRSDLINQALGITGSLADAEDVVQETFCEAFRGSNKLAKVSSMGAWLRTINKGNALNRISQKRRSTSHESKRLRDQPTIASGGFSGFEMREALASAIDALPEKMRRVMVLRFWDKLAFPEIAERLKLPQTTVWRLSYEASAILVKKLNIQIHVPAAGEPDVH